MKNNLLVNLINSTVLGDNRKKRQLIRLIKVDLENVNYEIFTDKYSKKLYGDDLFLFFNHKNNLIGASIGAIYQKDFEEFSVGKYLYENFRKNRSGLEEHAEIIIRIPAAERYYRPRYNKKYSAVKNNLAYDKELKERLAIFKNKKCEKYSDTDITVIQKRVVNYLMENLRNDDIIKSFNSIDCFASDIPSLLKSFVSDVRDYETHLRMLNEEKETLKNNNMEWVKSRSWNHKQLLKNIDKIIKWNNCLPEEA